MLYSLQRSGGGVPQTQAASRTRFHEEREEAEEEELFADNSSLQLLVGLSGSKVRGAPSVPHLYRFSEITMRSFLAALAEIFSPVWSQKEQLLHQRSHPCASR